MNNIAIWQKVAISTCETFHHFEEKPLYSIRFEKVLKYHAPGLAPVKDATGAYHIDLQGQAAYPTRFIETFGFYEGLASVRSNEGWFHINPKGSACFKERYLWCGNFQEGFCPVKDSTGLYYHINQEGQSIYKERYHYVGDYKDGIAVVCNHEGLHTHIDKKGQKIHETWFIDLDIFHKGFARAKDERGWFHVNTAGISIYPQRYANIEPFYNGAARVEAFDGAIIIINTQGKIITEIRTALQQPWLPLSGSMVGFWRTETIAAAVQLNIFQFLPGELPTIAFHAGLPEKHLERILRALWELDLVCLQNQHWQLTKQGELLSPQDKRFLAAASIMWSDINTDIWKHLPERIRMGFDSYHPVFKAWAADDKLEIYHRAIDGYAALNADIFLEFIDWKSHQQIIGIERNSKVLLEKLLAQYQHLQVTLLGDEYIMKFANIDKMLSSAYALKPHDVLKPWPLLADAIILPKILHFWPEKEALQLLNNARKALLPGGKIYILEMLLKEGSPDGSLLDLNILVETGGRLRFLADWEKLFSEAKLTVCENRFLASGLNLLILGS